MPVIVGDRHVRLAVVEADRPVEAGAATGVACGVVAGDRDLEPDGVLIAIGPNFLDSLQIAGALAFLPEAAARAAVVVGNAGLDRQRQSVGVHMRDHQKLAIACVCNNRGDQPLLVETGREGRTGLQFGLIFRGESKVSVIA